MREVRIVFAFRRLDELTAECGTHKIGTTLAKVPNSQIFSARTKAIRPSTSLRFVLLPLPLLIMIHLASLFGLLRKNRYFRNSAAQVVFALLFTVHYKSRTLYQHICLLIARLYFAPVSFGFIAMLRAKMANGPLFKPAFVLFGITTLIFFVNNWKFVRAVPNCT